MIRDALDDDAAAMAQIYAPYVTDSATSFEARPPSASEMRRRLHSIREGGYPWIVATDAGKLLGYAYGSPHRAREAYQWSVETTVYLAAEAQGRGLGTELMHALLTQLTEDGFALALAGVTLPNPASVGLHRKLGFSDVGVYHGVGFKHGAWHDVWWGQLRLSAPSAPIPPSTLRPRG